MTANIPEGENATENIVPYMDYIDVILPK